MSIHAMPNTPSSAGDSPVMPSSPAELPVPAQSQATNDAAPVRRKASRRANTAERRATHNAVERQRRETLNGRFLDLAALLPNLASVRRPSKSAIVNSSIALVHSQRRQRAVAARELRQLKVEADALRRELNEWRERANVPRIEEPARNADFVALLNLEEEEIGEDERRAYEMRDGDDAEDLDEEGSDHIHELHQNHAPAPVMTSLPTMAPSYNGNYHDQAGLVVSGTAPDPEKVAAWNQHLYSALAQSQWAQQAQAAHTALFTPPSSAHGVAPPNPFAQANHGYLANFQRPHNGLSPVPVHYTHGEDDNSSVGSAGSGSPHGSQGSLPGSYEIPGPFAFDPYTAAAAPRRPSVQIPPMAISGPGGAWSPHGQMMKTSPVPIQAGGGGGGAHFAMNLLL